MKISSLLSLLLIFILGGPLFGQTLVFNVVSTSELPGSLVTVDISVENFNTIIGYQGTISWDSNVLEYQSISSPNAGLSTQIGPPNTGTIPMNKATFNWFDLSGTGESRDDGTVILQINFQVVATAIIGTVTTVSIDGSSTALGYVDGSFTFNPNPIVNPGTVGVGVNFPVEMLDFQANAKDGIAKLEWITASEEGNDYFEVQKSENGEDFFPIGTVKGAGNSQEHTYYSFDDPISATSLYYRLLQVDFDGTTSLTDVVELSVDAPSNDWIQVFPNPSENVTQIRLENWEDLSQNFRIQLYTIDGRLMMEERIEGSKLVTDYTLGVAKYPRGSYLLKVTNALGKTSQNLLILH